MCFHVCPECFCSVLIFVCAHLLLVCPPPLRLVLVKLPYRRTPALDEPCLLLAHTLYLVRVFSSVCIQAWFVVSALVEPVVVSAVALLSEFLFCFLIKSLTNYVFRTCGSQLHNSTLRLRLSSFKTAQHLPVVRRLLLLAASAIVSAAAARLTALPSSGFSSWMMDWKRLRFSLLL